MSRADHFLAWLAFIWAAAIVLAIVLGVGRADAQGAQVLCAPLPDLLDGIRRKFGETPLFYGKSSAHAFIMTQAQNGSWTLIQIGPGGEPACIIAGGSESRDARGEPT